MLRNEASVAISWYRHSRVSIGFVRGRVTNRGYSSRSLVSALSPSWIRSVVVAFHVSSEALPNNNAVICPLRLTSLCFALLRHALLGNVPVGPPKGDTLTVPSLCGMEWGGVFCGPTCSPKYVNLPRPVSADSFKVQEGPLLETISTSREQILCTDQHQSVVTLQLQIWLQHSRLQY